MDKIEMYDYQMKAIRNMHNGCILCGGVGSGKSRTSLAYYFINQHGELDPLAPMRNPKDIYIITTARKRDTGEWEEELNVFGISSKPSNNSYSNTVVIDSWNNIHKYQECKDAFFIFDEQRVVGYGAWVKSFLQIAKANEWILLSATPGDTWSDYIPVFIANGFYKNKTEFTKEHIVFSRFTKYPEVQRYLNTGRLLRLRNLILVDMEFERKTNSHSEILTCDYDKLTYKTIMKDRWDPFNNLPVETASELCYLLRKIINVDPTRIDICKEIVKQKEKVIIFYNYNYERDILLEAEWPIINGHELEIAEWNGHKHQPIPESDYWIYLVQYTAGAEGWNCIRTDTIIFYSLNYSYKIMKQASGRIDRLNTKYTDLYYYYLRSPAPIDIGISRALHNKRRFNETRFVSIQ